MNWWDGNWQVRQKIRSQADGDAYTSGIHFLHVDVDLDKLVLNGLLRSDYKDLRVVYQSGTESINIPYYIALNKEPERVYFAAQNNIPSGINIGTHDLGWRYYVYYGYNDGDTSGLPATYINRNFPQAPYSATTDWYQPSGAASGFRDKCLYRFNDDPSVGDPERFTDATGFTSGVTNYTGGYTSGIYKGYDGRLDLATEFNRSNKGIMLAEDNDDGTTVASGNWCIDFWVYPYATAGTQYWFIKWANNSLDAVTSRFIYSATYSKFSEYTYQRRDYRFIANSWNAGASAGVEANQWTHIRLYYAKKSLTTWSCTNMYINGALKGSSLGCYWPPAEPYHTQMESGVCAIGGTANSEFDGKFEQFRYSTHPWFAQLSYDESNGDSRYAPPDWRDNEYTLYLDDMEINDIPPSSGEFGGYTEGIEVFAYASGTWGGLTFSAILGSVVFGGYAFARDEIVSLFGGYVDAARGTMNATVGGVTIGFAPLAGYVLMGGIVPAEGRTFETGIGGIANAEKRYTRVRDFGGTALSYAGHTQETFGGFTLGTWTSPDSIVECAARGLVKSLADTQHKQKFSLDGDITLYANHLDTFDAELDVAKIQKSQFDSLLRVQKTRKNPLVTITSTSITGSGPWNATVIASGHAFDKNGNIISSGLHHASIVWTDGDHTVLPNVVASGSILQFTHSYSSSGIYKPIVAVRDKFSRTGSDDTTINLASGLGVPYIKLSATPRVGSAPPPFYAEVGATLSGVQGSYSLFWDYGNGLSFYNNATSGTAQYALPGDYIPYVRIRDARQIFVVDTLRVGFNQ